MKITCPTDESHPLFRRRWTESHYWIVDRTDRELDADSKLNDDDTWTCETCKATAIVDVEAKFELDPETKNALFNEGMARRFRRLGLTSEGRRRPSPNRLRGYKAKDGCFFGYTVEKDKDGWFWARALKPDDSVVKERKFRKKKDATALAEEWDKKHKEKPGSVKT
jgi:hypothetical protein